MAEINSNCTWETHERKDLKREGFVYRAVWQQQELLTAAKRG